MKARIQTPIWTGNIDSESPTLRTTGILGSLRWWTESLLRGINKQACDPTSRENCPDEKEKIKYYCLACLIFGATGLSKSFKSRIDCKCSPVFVGTPINIKPENRRRGWYLGSGLVGKFELSFLPLVKSFEEALVEIPLAIASKWGGMGAKTQLGYGVFQLEGYPADTDIQSFLNALKSIQHRLEFVQNAKFRDYVPNSEEYPNIRDFFFAKMQFESLDDWWKGVDGIGKRNRYSSQAYDREVEKWIESGSVPIAPAIKNWIRFGKLVRNRKGKEIPVSPFKEIYNPEISKWLFGDMSQRIASKINISSAYRMSDNIWEFRIWGWVPESKGGFRRDEFLHSLKMSLANSNNKVMIPWNNLLGKEAKKTKLASWRQFNSDNYTEGKEHDIYKYIDSLLEEV